MVESKLMIIVKAEILAIPAMHVCQKFSLSIHGRSVTATLMFDDSAEVINHYSSATRQALRSALPDPMQALLVCVLKKPHTSVCLAGDSRNSFAHQVNCSLLCLVPIDEQQLGG
jgi:hypothetical protein